MTTTKQQVDNIYEEDFERAKLKDQLFLLEQQVKEENEFWEAYNSMEGIVESEKFNSLMEEGKIIVERAEYTLPF